MAKKNFNVNFSDEANAQLQDMAQKAGTTKADIIRQALALQKWFTDTQQSGSKIIVEQPDGSLQQVITPK